MRIPPSSSAQAEPAAPLLEVRGLSKAFPGVQALADVSLTVAAGTVHAVLGVNGAGKSTLMRILAGWITPDRGEIRLRGQPVRLANPHQARRLGIAMIHQELMPFPNLTVAENLFMGQEPTVSGLGWVRRGRLRAEAVRLLGRLGVELLPDQRMGRLSVAEMQVVEIARALAQQATLLIMDEPTSALSQREVERLFGLIAELKAQGVALLFISHKLEEVFRVADWVTVLRDGAVVGSQPVSQVTADQLIRWMVGQPLPPLARAPQRGQPAAVARAAGVPEPSVAESRSVDRPQGSPVDSGPMTRAGCWASPVALSVRRLTKRGRFRDVSFDLRRGEVLGLAGLMGAGRTAVLQAIYGLAPADAGEIYVAGQQVRIRRPSDALRHGIALVPEDRKGTGLVLSLSVKHNFTLATLARWCWAGWINHRLETRLARERLGAVGIGPEHLNRPVWQLSGGNQQKVVLGRMLLAEPAVLLLDEPTRGIDVGAKAEVYAAIGQLARAGKAVLLVSSELPELLMLCDRLVVLRQGSVSAELDARHATPEQVLRAAMPV